MEDDLVYGIRMISIEMEMQNNTKILSKRSILENIIEDQTGNTHSYQQRLWRDDDYIDCRIAQGILKWQKSMAEIWNGITK